MISVSPLIYTIRFTRNKWNILYFQKITKLKTQYIIKMFLHFINLRNEPNSQRVSKNKTNHLPVRIRAQLYATCSCEKPRKLPYLAPFCCSRKQIIGLRRSFDGYTEDFTHRFRFLLLIGIRKSAWPKIWHFFRSSMGIFFFAKYDHLFACTNQRFVLVQGETNILQMVPRQNVENTNCR